MKKKPHKKRRLPKRQPGQQSSKLQAASKKGKRFNLSVVLKIGGQVVGSLDWGPIIWFKDWSSGVLLYDGQFARLKIKK